MDLERQVVVASPSASVVEGMSSASVGEEWLSSVGGVGWQSSVAGFGCDFGCGAYFVVDSVIILDVGRLKSTLKVVEVVEGFSRLGRWCIGLLRGWSSQVPGDGDSDIHGLKVSLNPRLSSKPS